MSLCSVYNGRPIYIDNGKYYAIWARGEAAVFSSRQEAQEWIDEKLFPRLDVVYTLFANEQSLLKIHGENISVATVVFIRDYFGHPIVYDTTNVAKADVDEFVRRMVRELGRACYMHYEFIRKIDNVYFFK